MALAQLQTRFQHLPSLEAFEKLKADHNAVLIDVRMPSEWVEVGCPDPNSIVAKLILLPWISGHHEHFVTSLVSTLETLTFDQDPTLYFICRSGGRSSSAAAAFAALSHKEYSLWNVSDGFEGTHSPYGLGWKNSDLPWIIPEKDFQTAQYPILLTQ